MAACGKGLSPCNDSRQSRLKKCLQPPFLAHQLQLHVPSIQVTPAQHEVSKQPWKGVAMTLRPRIVCTQMQWRKCTACGHQSLKQQSPHDQGGNLQCICHDHNKQQDQRMQDQLKRVKHLPLCQSPQIQKEGTSEVCCLCHLAGMFPDTRQSLPPCAT